MSTVAVVIPALNEEAALARVLADLPDAGVALEYMIGTMIEIPRAAPTVAHEAGARKSPGLSRAGAWWTERVKSLEILPRRRTHESE